MFKIYIFSSWQDQKIFLQKHCKNEKSDHIPLIPTCAIKSEALDENPAVFKMIKYVAVRRPVNVENPEHYFDSFDYVSYQPTIIHRQGTILVTRIGQCFSRTGYLRRTMYSNTFVFARSMLVSLLSMVRRGVTAYKADNKRVVVIHTPWTAGYYHWVTESLPRLLACRDSGWDLKILLPNKEQYSGFAESVTLLGIHDVDYFPNGKNVLVHNALITTVPREFGTTSPEILQKIRDIYTEAVVNKTPVGATNARRIYVSRKRARGRKVINETDVIALLAKYGFEEVAFEDYDFSAQVRLMSETEALVSIHGAALTNMTFMPNGGSVLEFVPHKRPLLDFNIVRMSFKHDPCYLRLASAMGHRYFMQPCTPVNIPDRTTHMADMVVDIDLLQKNVEDMLAMSASTKQ